MILAQLAQQAYEETAKAYGHEPTWDEFKAALGSTSGIEINNSLAGQLAHSKLVYTTYDSYKLGIMDLSSLILVPSVIAMWYLTGISAWWILASLITAAIIMKHGREAQRTALTEAARKNEGTYTHLLRMGAFRFRPAHVAS